MKLLKIGTLNVPNTRWIDALEYFSEIHVVCMDSEPEIQDDRIKYIKFNTKSY